MVHFSPTILEGGGGVREGWLKRSIHFLEDCRSQHTKEQNIAKMQCYYSAALCMNFFLSERLPVNATFIIFGNELTVRR